MELIYKQESYNIMGACFEVYNDKGNGFVEPVYQECMEIELGMQKIPYSPQHSLGLNYKGIALKQKYIPDFLCYEKIILELKSVKQLNDEHRAQVQNYLKATGCRLGLLVNFASYPKLEWERIVH